MTSGTITNLRVSRVRKNSFAVTWNAAHGATRGYSYVVRDLHAHTQVTQGHVLRTNVMITGLKTGTLYNFGVQGLPGGPGANIHVTTTSAVTAQGGNFPGKQTGLKGFAMSLMIRYGWGIGQQWIDFQNVEMREAGWNPLATNSSSGAFGLAQALGHGTANTRGTITNEYGNFGTPDFVNRAANSGNGFAQLIWMCNYIRAKYGNPAGAWQSELANGSY